MRRLTVVLIVLSITIVGLATMVPTVSAPNATYHLSYKGRYEHGEGPDHLMGVELVNDELFVTGALGA